MKINSYKKLIFIIVLFLSILAMSTTASKGWYFMELPDGTLGIDSHADPTSPIYYSEEGTYYCITKGSPFSSSMTHGHYHAFIKKFLSGIEQTAGSWHKLVRGTRGRF